MTTDSSQMDLYLANFAGSLGDSCWSGARRFRGSADGSPCVSDRVAQRRLATREVILSAAGAAMLRSDLLHLRPVQQGDLDDLYARMNRLEHRGAFFPMGLYAEPKFRRRFDETGFWSDDEGMLVMVDTDHVIVGEIEFYPIASYLTGYELQRGRVPRPPGLGDPPRGPRKTG